jgi:hypothetical protein
MAIFTPNDFSPVRSIFLLLMLACAGRAFGQGAAFSFKEKVHDFGEVPVDSPLKWRFEFTNSGDAPLIITGIEPSCHCVSTQWTRGVIAPGATGFVDVSVSPPHDMRFYRTLMISSNAVNYDPALMRYEIDVTGRGVAGQPQKKSTSRTKSRPHRR